MRITIKLRGTDEETRATLREQIARRVDFALERFSEKLGSVLVRLDDLNGPRGGVDKRCQVQLRGPTIGELVFEVVDSAWGAAIDRALSLAGRSVSRALGRERRVRGLALELRKEIS